MAMVIGLTIVIFNINQRTSKGVTVEGWLLFFLSVAVCALFGIPGLFALTLGGKLIIAIHSSVTGKKV